MYATKQALIKAVALALKAGLISRTQVLDALRRGSVTKADLELYREASR